MTSYCLQLVAPSTGSVNVHAQSQYTLQPLHRAMCTVLSLAKSGVYKHYLTFASTASVLAFRSPLPGFFFSLRETRKCRQHDHADTDVRVFSRRRWQRLTICIGGHVIRADTRCITGNWGSLRCARDAASHPGSCAARTSTNRRSRRHRSARCSCAV